MLITGADKLLLQILHTSGHNIVLQIVLTVIKSGGKEKTVVFSGAKLGELVEELPKAAAPTAAYPALAVQHTVVYIVAHIVFIAEMIIKCAVGDPNVPDYLRNGQILHQLVVQLFKGGAGLIIPGGMNVDPTWPSQLPMQPALYHDMFIPSLMKLAEAGKINGAKILFQLWHGGAVNYSGVEPPTVNDIDVAKIREIQDKFEDAARRAIIAGADGVEFQMCHTYLANQFLSPAFNHRSDEYGAQNLENQLRFSIEKIKRIRAVIGPDKILAVKLQGYDCTDNGITPEMAAQFAPYVEKAGADMITVSGGGSLTDITGMSGDGKRAEGWQNEVLTGGLAV